ncbi:hypothetical protein RJT34_16177 [Clitoria ternatea]|uniref:Transmembrane protein n=1 Tax=Clitoria ternatea TaxID=43366 RepID=A0AAN9PDF7_CLITE
MRKPIALRCALVGRGMKPMWKKEVKLQALDNNKRKASQALKTLDQRPRKEETKKHNPKTKRTHKSQPPPSTIHCETKTPSPSLFSRCHLYYSHSDSTSPRHSTILYILFCGGVFFYVSFFFFCLHLCLFSNFPNTPIFLYTYFKTENNKTKKKEEK